MKILLGLTGSVASILAPKLVQALQAAGHEVQVVATKSSLYFFEESDLGVKVWNDAHEWPLGTYTKGQPIPHIDLGKWADALVIAPLSANTLGKIANGLCDNLLTCVFRAFDLRKRVVLAPAMNSNMWRSPFTQKQLRTLLQMPNLDQSLRIVNPVVKALACGDTDIGAMANIDKIVKAIN